MRRMALALVLWASSVQGASAQSGDRWLVIPVAGPAEPWTAPTISFLHGELAARGLRVWDAANATARFEAQGSAPAVELSAEERTAWDRAAQEVLESLVRGDPGAALRTLVSDGLLSLPTVSALNREADGAQRVLDTCLLGVRAELETRGASSADAMARDCRRLGGNAAPSPMMHPPAVTDALARADRIRAQKRAALSVQSKPEGCAARVNGTVLGSTPVYAEALVPGEYSVQVECDLAAQGRIHRVDVGLGFTEVSVDLGLDAAVTTTPTLGLAAEKATNQAPRRSYATKIASVVPATTLVLVRRLGPNVLELERVRAARAAQVALVRIATGPTGPTRGDLALAARALQEERCMDLTTLPPSDLACEAHPAATVADDWPAARTPRGKYISGLTLVGAGAASLVTGYVLSGPRARASEEWVQNLDLGLGGAERQQAWVNMGIAQIVTASIGGGALVAAMPLALPKRAKTPWWGWLSGGLGLGAAAASIALGVSAPDEPATSCSQVVTDSMEARTCVDRAERIGVAALLGATAAPLIAIPLVYLLRPSRSKLTPELEASRSGGYFGLSGSF